MGNLIWKDKYLNFSGTKDKSKAKQFLLGQLFAKDITNLLGFT